MQTAMTLPAQFPIPMPVGNLDSYIQTVNRFPLLSLEQEQQLARRYRDTEDLDAARGMVLSHLRLVVSVARGYLGYGLPHAYLIQEGNIGLMKAVKRYDPERGVRLVSFAIHWIKAEIHEYVLRNWRMVKIATTKAQRKLFFNLRSMKRDSATLSPADVARMAATLNVKPEEVSEMEMRLAGQEMTFEADEDDETYAPANYLTADASADPSRMLESAQSERLRTDGLARALEGLDPRSRRIVESRWLQEKDSLTLHDLAAEFKVSAERIRQIESKALEKMRKLMAPA